MAKQRLNPLEIAVISPYSAQVSLLKEYIEDEDEGRDWLAKGLEVRTVDGFQGREEELVVLSMVRSNLQKQVGFLADERRINVAITRAKRQVVVICDSETVGSNDFLDRLLQYIENEHSTLSYRHSNWCLRFVVTGSLSNSRRTFCEYSKSNRS